MTRVWRIGDEDSDENIKRVQVWVEVCCQACDRAFQIYHGETSVRCPYGCELC